MKEYFRVRASKYVPDKDFNILRPASINQPKNNSVMFILESKMELATVLQRVSECLIFWPESVAVPETIEHVNAVVLCTEPHSEFCRFFRDNGITNLPQNDEYQMINGSAVAKGAVIGQNVVLMPGAYIGKDCFIGNDVYIGCGVKLVGTIEIGNGVVIRENTVIGADGLTTDREIDGTAITMPQFGSIVLEDNVQIGANSVIARGAIDETRVGRGSKIDSCTFISHNVSIGRDTFIVGETIMFGSASAGDRCLISGNSTIMNAKHIGNDAVVGAGSVVTKSVTDGRVVKGNPAKTKEETK